MKGEFFPIKIVLLLTLIFSCKPEEKDKLINQYDSIDLTLTTSIDPANYTLENLYSMADASYKMMAYTESIKYLDEIIKRDSLRGEAYFLRAKCYRNINQDDLSNQDYLAAIRNGYRISDSYFGMGRNYLTMNNDSAALASFKEVIKHDPGNWEAKYYVDRLETALGKQKKKKESSV